MNLTDLEIHNEIMQVIKDNPESISLTNEQIKEIKEIYNRLSSERNIIEKTKTDKLSVVSGITIAVNEHTSENAIWNRFADNKHLSYFDAFLGEGERGKIQKAFSQNNLPTELLKGIRKNTDYSNTTIVNGQSVTIEQITDIDADGYRYVSEFNVYVDGDLIYDFKADRNFMTESVRKSFLERAEDILEMSEGSFFDGETITKRKVNTPNYSYVEEAYQTSKGDISTRKRYAAGTVIDGVKVGGRFIRK